MGPPVRADRSLPNRVPNSGGSKGRTRSQNPKKNWKIFICAAFESVKLRLGFSELHPNGERELQDQSGSGRKTCIKPIYQTPGCFMEDLNGFPPNRSLNNQRHRTVVETEPRIVSVEKKGVFRRKTEAINRSSEDDIRCSTQS